MIGTTGTCENYQISEKSVDTFNVDKEFASEKHFLCKRLVLSRKCPLSKWEICSKICASSFEDRAEKKKATILPLLHLSIWVRTTLPFFEAWVAVLRGKAAGIVPWLDRIHLCLPVFL